MEAEKVLLVQCKWVMRKNRSSKKSDEESGDMPGKLYDNLC